MKVVRNNPIRTKAKSINKTNAVKGQSAVGAKKVIKLSSAKFITTGHPMAKKIVSYSTGKKAPIPSGMAETSAGIVVPSKLIKPIPASKLKKGFEMAKSDINGMINEVASIITNEYNIKEIELDGQFQCRWKIYGFRSRWRSLDKNKNCTGLLV